jgi:hypothetical protein
MSRDITDGHKLARKKRDQRAATLALVREGMEHGYGPYPAEAIPKPTSRQVALNEAHCEIVVRRILIALSPRALHPPKSAPTLAQSMLSRRARPFDSTCLELKETG